MADMTDDEVNELQWRVAKGITWLTEHDPTGAFHFWFTSRIGPRARMPAQDEARREAYAEYFKARTAWEQLSAKLARVDPSWRDAEPVANALKGAGA